MWLASAYCVRTCGCLGTVNVSLQICTLSVMPYPNCPIAGACLRHHSYVQVSLWVGHALGRGERGELLLLLRRRVSDLTS